MPMLESMFMVSVGMCLAALPVCCLALAHMYRRAGLSMVVRNGLIGLAVVSALGALVFFMALGNWPGLPRSLLNPLAGLEAVFVSAVVFCAALVNIAIRQWHRESHAGTNSHGGGQ